MIKHKQRFLLFVFGFLLCFLSLSPLNAAGDTSGSGQAGNAAVSEEQVREILLDMLGTQEPEPVTESTTTGSLSYDEKTLSQWEPTEANIVVTRLREMKQNLPTLWGEVKAAFLRSTTPEEGFAGWPFILTMLMHLALGLALEYLVTRPLLKRLYQYADSQQKTHALKIKFVLTRLTIQMLGLVIMATTIYVCGLFSIKQNPYFELLFLEALRAFVLFRLSMLVSRSVLSPFSAPLRLLKLRDVTAKKIYYWSILFFGYYELEIFALEYLRGAGLDKLLIDTLLVPMSIGSNAIILAAIWSMRKRITGMFVDEESIAYQNSSMSRFFVQLWPYFITVWLLVIWGLWQYRNLQDRPELAASVGVAWVITLLFPVADRVFNSLLINVVKIPWLQSPSFERRSRRFIHTVQTGFRIILLTIVLFTLAHSWGVNAADIMMPLDGGGFGGKVLDLLIIGTTVYVFWELMHALVERKLPEEESALASLEGDGGGVGATRAETLLPLIRTTLTVVLGIFLVISVLHALGVAITPLLAGAGVVGIAIGFGAQKLVQDILSGIFFLIDDAFRKGEYIELENLRGTVERISLRSMQLRHHLGAVQTIPYGEIKTVKNLSRDWITMKLELRLPYDTDIEKVRKIIKKVGQSMLQDEEMGPSFLLPLKSQGVMRMEESALIVRMKFTTKPGEQWVIRREAYRRVRDALSEAGIHFAHREVRVLLPESALAENDGQAVQVPDGDSNAPEENTGQNAVQLQKVAAAAVTSMLAAEAAKHSLRDGDMGGGDDR